jgi:hypothetical protein
MTEMNDHAALTDGPPSEEHDCQMCGGAGVFLGWLGLSAWFRCRQCGMEFSLEVEREHA